MDAATQNTKLPNVTVLLSCVRASSGVLDAWVQRGVRNSEESRADPRRWKTGSSRKPTGMAAIHANKNVLIDRCSTIGVARNSRLCRLRRWSQAKGRTEREASRHLVY
jgi:hypothetical protein